MWLSCTISALSPTRYANNCISGKAHSLRIRSAPLGQGAVSLATRAGLLHLRHPETSAAAESDGRNLDYRTEAVRDRLRHWGGVIYAGICVPGMIAAA